MAAAPPLVLAADDAPEILGLYEALLTDAGYRVALSPRLPGAAEVGRLAPDLLILDLLFGQPGPGEPVLRLLEDLRQSEATAGLSVIVCTGAVPQAEAAAARLAAAEARVVLKPFDVDALLALARDLCARSEAARWRSWDVQRRSNAALQRLRDACGRGTAAVGGELIR